MKKQVWHCAAMTRIGYHVGDEDEVVWVANQLVECRIKLDQNACEEEMLLVSLSTMRAKLLARLTSSLENYGVVGLKRWTFQVPKFNRTRVEECEDEDGKGGESR
jgi:hypothetical protein